MNTTPLLASSTTNLALLPGWLDPENLLTTLGPWVVLGIVLIIFAECGLLVGFFLPGDTLLFTAGLLTATGGIDLNPWLLTGLLALAAFLGNMLGYAIGYHVGPAVFSQPDARYLKPEYINKSEAFFAKHGKPTVILARFVPVVRTLATVMAGASRMNILVYTLYSAIGGVIWVTLLTFAGVSLGQIPIIRNNVDIIVVAGVVIVVCAAAVPGVGHWLQHRRAPGRHRSNQARSITIWPRLTELNATVADPDS
jgi:membrane-associated protein